MGVTATATRLYDVSTRPVDGARAGHREHAAARLNELLSRQAARLSARLHDDAAQVLAYAQMTLEEVGEEIPAPLKARLDVVRRHLNGVAGQLRCVSHDLHAAIVDDLGLVDAIRYTARVFSRRLGVPVTLTVSADEPCDRRVAGILFRVVDEALANIAAHAAATSVTIVVVRDGAGLACTIADDGVGFEAAAIRADPDRGLGLALMQARVEAVNGMFAVTSAPGAGTRLRVVVPVEG